MRRTEYLITEIRNSTDNTDDNGVKDAEIISYLNYGQKLIQNIIFAANPKADIFKKTISYDYDAAGEYKLPEDIHAVNAIRDVFYISADQECPIDLIDPREQSCGYYTEENKLFVKGYENFSLKVKYFNSLPRMDKRWGRVKTVTPNTSLELAAGYDAYISTVDDYVSVVAKFGAQVIAGIFIDNFNDATLETSEDLIGVLPGQFVCLGKNSVNSSLLPDDCETYLLDYVRQRLHTRNNYEDGGKQLDFTAGQRADITALFANNQRDILTPPLTDLESMDW